MSASDENKAIKGRVLFVEDEPDLLRAYQRAAARAGFTSEGAADGQTAARLAETEQFDVIVSDLALPGLNGIDLLRSIRRRDLDVPVIIVTGGPSTDTAAQAVEFGALRYLEKPVDMAELAKVLERAVQLHRLARAKREALELLGKQGMQLGDRVGLEISFERAMASLWLAFQPIVSWSRRSVYAYEALMRSTEKTLPHPGAIIAAAERLGRLCELGQTTRQHAASVAAPPEGVLLFVNLHSQDLLDAALYSAEAPLSRIAGRVVLEITERAALDDVKDAAARVAALREMGYRVALDDLGAGYAGLNSFALLQPELVKIDMALVRDLHREPIKRRLIHSIVGLCKEMNLEVVAEGVECAEERDALVAIGCDLLQGYLFARPGPAFPTATF